LDAVTASGFSISRARAAELIASGRVQKNYRETTKPDAPVAQGDVISARGVGKFELSEVGGLSRKGRTAILLRRYL
ncbi:MAG: RNA-binding protein, partial [Oscillospiraceae bacterium]|nr:RNA-binding protein [Oscillospiraceae bacterium]